MLLISSVKTHTETQFFLKEILLSVVFVSTKKMKQCKIFNFPGQPFSLDIFLRIFPSDLLKLSFVSRHVESQL